MTAEKKTRWGFIRNLGPLLGLLILCVVLTGLSDRFFTMDNLLNVTRQVSINAVISVGMTLVILTGGIDLSVGSILAFAGSITAGLLSGGQSLITAIIVGVVAVIMIIFGGFKYITSGGESNNISSAKNTIIYAIANAKIFVNFFIFHILLFMVFSLFTLYL